MFKGIFNGFTEEELDFINADKDERPKYKEKYERNDPFELNTIRFNMTHRMYSKFLNREIITLNDACEHANYQLRAWAKEDKAELRRAQNQRYHQKRKSNSIDFHPEVIAARNQLENYIKQRKDAIEQWDLFIRNQKHIFNELRINLQMKVRAERELNDQSK